MFSGLSDWICYHEFSKGSIALDILRCLEVWIGFDVLRCLEVRIGFVMMRCLELSVSFDILRCLGFARSKWLEVRRGFIVCWCHEVLRRSFCSGACSLRCGVRLYRGSV